MAILSVAPLRVVPAATGGGGGVGGPTALINKNNPASASSISFGGDTWSFSGTTAVDTSGDWVVTRNGTTTNPAGGGAFHLEVLGGTLYAYHLQNTNWSQWNGTSWSSIGSAPPVTSTTSIPQLLGSNCCGASTPWPPWLGRIPDYADNFSGYGANAGFAPCADFGGGGPPVRPPCDVAYEVIYPVVDIDNIVHCTAPDGTSLTTPAQINDAFIATAAGTYDTQINSSTDSFLVPMVAKIYYIRIAREWNGNWMCESPWTAQSGGTATESSPSVTPTVWINAWRHVRTLLANKLLPLNPNIKFEWDGPNTDTEATYYPGDDVVDLIGQDVYVQNIGTPIDAWRASVHSPGLTGSGGHDLGIWLTFAQKRNKAIVVPEWSDATTSPYTVDTTIITQMANLWASVQGPGNAAIVAQAYWDNDSACPGCGLGDYAPKKAAYGQAYPNGYLNTVYGGTYWPLPLITMPAGNYWQ